MSVSAERFCPTTDSQSVYQQRVFDLVCTQHETDKGPTRKTVATRTINHVACSSLVEPASS